MADLTGFDANDVDPRGDFEPLPEGSYLAVITDSDMKENKAGTGRYLKLTFQVADGPHKGRLLWEQLNLHHPNELAVKIARAELSAICRAVGVMAPQDSGELHDLPLVIRVRCMKRKDTGDLVNVIKGYGKPETTAATTTAARPSPSSTPPWRR
jgi:Protein of unknown function (DUF669)